ncbi:MAG: hypothetical protein ACLPLR_05325 [Terriglobales bacterium]
MSRMKSIFTLLVLAAIVCIVPQASATTVKVMIAGSSAMWQTMALGAYHSGVSIAVATNKTCHYTGTSNFNLTDIRPNTAVSGTPVIVDNGTTWIVWDYVPGTDSLGNPISCTAGNTTAVNVWAYIKVDSVVGNRCFFAAPSCEVGLASGTAFPAVGNKISKAPQNLWGDGSQDTLPPATVQALFLYPKYVSENVAATDIRPEDANFAACRVNSPLGSGGQTGSDGLDGLGFSQAGATQTAGDCFPYTTGAQGIINGVGAPIVSGYPGHASNDVANVASFALSGADPITGHTVQKYSVINVGAAPIVFVTARASSLATLTNATEQQLQQAFSGTNCNAAAFGLPPAGLNVFLREPLSGTYNTTEQTVMRYPTAYPLPVAGLSQETGVGANNPLAGLVCGDGAGLRWRAIGTGEEVKSVQNSTTAFPSSTSPNAFDGIGYTFFSYGNVGSIAGSANYGYVRVNGVDPIFASYLPIDPGEPGGGQLPLNTPCGVGVLAFPCNENQIWANGYSFPNLRNGTYRSWSILRLVPSTAAAGNAKALVTASNTYVVTTVPDYVPAPAVKSGTTVLDPGLFVFRSHYQQKDGSNPPTLIGSACNNITIGTVLEAGGDMGGMIINITGTIPVSATTETSTEKQCQLVQSGDVSGGLSPALRQ